MESNWSHPLGSYPKIDESIMGFVFRLSSRMGMIAAQGLWRRAGFYHLTNRPGTVAIESLALIARVDAAVLERMSYGDLNAVSYRFNGVRISAGLLKGHLLRRRLCPECLAESPHHRIWWDLACVSVCPAHERTLVGSCPDCLGDLNWTAGANLERCGCGSGNVLGSLGTRIARSESVASSVVQGLLGDPRYADLAGNAALLPPFVDLEPANIVEFIYRIGLDLAGHRPKVFSQEQAGELGDDAHIALRLGLDVARDWPNGFARALDATRERWGPSASGSSRRVTGAVKRWLDGLPDGSGRVIRVALEQYVRDVGPMAE